MGGAGRHIRGAVGTGLAWGAAWALGAVLVARVPGFDDVDDGLPFAFLIAPFGVVTGVVFSGVLAALGGRGGLERTSPSRFAAWGAASGLLPAVVVTALRGEAFGILVFGPVLAVAGAACAAGSLAAARRPERTTLPGPGGGPTEA